MMLGRLKQSVYKHKLFFKILMYFLSLLIPIVIIGYIVFLNVDQLMKKDVSEKLLDNLQSSSRNTDIYLEMVRSNNNNLLFGDILQQNLKPYNTLSEYEKLGATSIVRAIAANESTISSFVDKIFVYIDVDRVYTSTGVVNFDTFFDKFYSLPGYSKRFWHNKLQTDSIFELLAPVQTIKFNDAGIHVVPSLTTQYIDGHPATLVTTISLQAIKENLMNNSIYSTTQYVIVDPSDRILLQSGEIADEQVNAIRSFFSAKKESLVREMKINHTPSIVTSVSSETFGWSYYSITPVNAFNQEPSGILSLIFWICISLILIGIVFSLIFSMNLYNPIKNIRDILLRNEQNAGDIDETTGDELQMLGSRIHHLIIKKDDITQKKNEVSNELVEQLFLSFIKGQPWLQSDKMAQILEEIDFKEGKYLSCCFLFQFRDRFYHEISEVDRVLILEKLKKVLLGILRQNVNCYFVELEHNFYVGMVKLETDKDRSLLDQSLETVRRTFEYDMIYCDLTIGIGNLYSNVNDLSKSYNDAITAIDKRVSQPGLLILDAADLDIERMYYYSFLDEKKLVNGMKTGDMERLRVEVEAIIENNKNRGVSYSELGTLLVKLFNTGYRYITEKQLNILDLVTEQQYEALIQTHILPTEFKERQELLLRFYERIASGNLSHSERRVGTLVSTITAYIENNYEKDLHLEMIADEAGLSAKYLSRLFKETTGRNISEYISLIRMEKAKELLTQTDMRISDIADQIGIFSRTTFLRLFKKHEGVSPVEYRNANTRKGK
jgi:two-component system response regulator YesN